MTNGPLEAHAVARLLDEIGKRIELSGDSPFKARAYYNAAESLHSLTAPLAEVVAKGKLREIPGVGEAIAEKIIKLHKTGTHPTLEHLREQLPAGVLEMLNIPGLGPKKAVLIYSELKIETLAELEEACNAGRLKDCKGLGAALQRKILAGLEFMRKGQGQRLIHHAAELFETACANLQKSHPNLQRAVAAGSLRRCCELVDDPCIVAEDLSPGAPNAEIKFGEEMRVYLSDKPHYGTTLLFATGSAAHLEMLTGFARSKGLSLSGKGLHRGKEEISCPEESDVYAALGLQFIPPELREGRNEIELAATKKLPALVCNDDIRGVLHSHTDFSDGAETLKVMAEAVRKLGGQYYGVADHSQSAAYAGGMKEDKIAAQHKLADQLNAGYAAAGQVFRIFKGVESDIRDDGSLDYPEEVLARFDFIVASVHSRFTLNKEAQTQRLLKAVSNPHTTVLGHMTGRLLLRRDGYVIDIDEVLKACARHGVVVEINANPHRLDLDWRWHQRALELGCMLSINPDAHSVSELDLTRWGVCIARKGGVPKERVLNCMDLAQITGFFQSRKNRR